MASVLLTAFEPYDEWSTNASWLALVRLTTELPKHPKITTRLYPVDFKQVRQRLADDLRANYDVALHLGQAPGSAKIRLEAVGLNVGAELAVMPDAAVPLVADGAIAYRSELPLAKWAGSLREQGIPAQVSYHAGVYLCNATLYLSHYFAQQQGLRTRSAFLHVPLDSSQVLDRRQDLPSMPAAITAQAIRSILDDIAAG